MIYKERRKIESAKMMYEERRKIESAKTEDFDPRSAVDKNKTDKKADISDISDIEEIIYQLKEDFSFISPAITDFNYIGEGHFGYVFSARRDRKDIAFKLVKPSWIHPDIEKGWSETDIKLVKQNFMLECGMQKILSGIVDGIVDLYEGSEHRGHWYLATELMNRSYNLQSVVDHYRDFFLKDRLEMMIKITSIVEKIHNIEFHNDSIEKGFIHRDLKPENILFTRETNIDHAEYRGQLMTYLNKGWDLKITDFGLIRRIMPSGTEDEGHIMGTPNFMAPEQIYSPERVDHRADIYALGATFYVLCNEDYPRDLAGLSDEMDFRKLADIEARPFESMNPAIENLSEIVMTCLKRDPAERYQSAGRLLQDLSDYHKDIS